jgi:hypothetical protein
MAGQLGLKQACFNADLAYFLPQPVAKALNHGSKTRDLTCD